jgi:hypothetical protein
MVAPPDDCDIELGHYRGPLDRLLVALRDAGIESAVLELDGGGSDELWAFAERLTADDAELREQNRRAMHGTWNIGFIQFGYEPLALPLRVEVLDELLEMSERHADEEIAFHLYVRDDAGTLFEAPDVGDNMIFASRRLGQGARDAIERALGDGFTPVEDLPPAS